MRPINLLPEKHRARVPGQGSAGGGYVILGVLAGALLLVLAVVLTTNSINSKKDELTRTETEAQQAEAKAVSLQSFGNFAQVKEQRLLSVKQLADTRFDWERLMRELAHVLPERVYLSDADAAIAPEQTSTTPAASGGIPGGPTLQLTGCARHQPDVAVTMLRLRRLHRAIDVRLAESTRANIESGVAAGGSTETVGAPATAPGGAPACDGYTFDATVAFEASPAPVARPGGEDTRVPAALGGGS